MYFSRGTKCCYMHQTMISKGLDDKIVFIEVWHSAGPAGHGGRIQTFPYLWILRNEIPGNLKVKILILYCFPYKILRSTNKSFQDVKAELWVWMQTMGTTPCEYIYQNFHSRWNPDHRGSCLRGSVIYTINYYLFFPFYMFHSRMEHSSCGNMRAQFLLVTSIDRLKQDEELALSFLCVVSAGLICNLECVCVCVCVRARAWCFYSVLVIFFFTD